VAGYVTRRFLDSRGATFKVSIETVCSPNQEASFVNVLIFNCGDIAQSSDKEPG
jgi:hypothetical protein